MGVVADRVKETTTTTGTGNLVLAGAVAGFRTFNTAIGQFIPFNYALLDADGTAWETGEGTMISSTALVRARIYKSTNSDAAISLSSGTHTVFCSYTADPIMSLPGKCYAATRGFLMP
jgi:hypothetical protein